MGESNEGAVVAMEMVEEGQIQLAPNLIELLKLVEEEEEDRISPLPDSLLLEILSRLPSTKDAITTGILSKRWKSLWTLVPTLIFKHDDDNHKFISLVDKTLIQCRQSKLKKFVLYTVYDIRIESQVNNWIRFAIRCNVEELHITLWNTEFKPEFPIDQSFFISSCFTDLRLEGCILHPVGIICWKNLRSLCISWGHIDEDMFQNILSGSPQLETLVLEFCYGYRRLNITSKNIKNLVLSGYMIPYDVFEADIIEINAPYILSLKVYDHLLLWKVLLVNVSSLVKAYLDYKNSESTPKEVEEEMLKGLIVNLSHVKELKIGVLCSEVLSRLNATSFVFPSNVNFPDVSSTL